MQVRTIQRILGLLVMLFSLTMLMPLALALFLGEPEWVDFLFTAAVTFFLGVFIWFPVRKIQRELRTRDGFVVVVMFWTVLGVFGAIPFMFDPSLPFTEAVFEAVSGITTTGATVITGLDDLPKSILFYRQQLQWLGGIGVVVLAVAILPMLGVGGMQLYRAETPGPVKDAKLTPRLTETARSFSLIYVGLTAVCTLAYWAAGMSFFDAVCHSFSSVSTAGFSTHDASIAHFQSPLIEFIACVFMILGAVNFAIHFLVWRQLDLRYYWKDTEARALVSTLVLFSILIAAVLVYYGHYSGPLEALRYAGFQVVSIVTTTGYTTDNFSVWPSFAPVLLMVIAFIGGCAGSTSGGLKVIRVLLLYKQGVREIERLAHPRGVFPVKVGGRTMPNQIVDAIWGFFSLYILSTVALTLLLIGTGLDPLIAFSAIAACINNAGPGLGDLTANFQIVSDFGKWVCIFAMLLGRLEVFTLFVLFTPIFWRR